MSETRLQAVETGLLPIVLNAETDRGPFHDLHARMRAHRVPGCSVAVVEEGEVDWARGYGLLDAETEAPTETTSIFQSGSTSKAVTALAALRLVERGLLDLDRDVNSYLSSWKVPDNPLTKDTPVTLRRILAHEAGLTVHGFPGYEADQPIPTLLQILDGLSPANTPAVRVDLEPGTLWRYSGGGYQVLQQMMIEVTGEEFPGLMRELVFDPLGMTRSTFEQPLPSSWHAGAASAHDNGGGRVPGKFYTYPEMAAAGLWTTPTDLARFVIGVQRAWRGAPGALLGRRLAREMLSTAARHYGLGFMLAGQGPSSRFLHGGINHGFEAEMIGYVQKGRGVAVMANASGSSGLIAEIVDAVARAYDWEGFPLREQLIDEPRAESELVDYVGRYMKSGDKGHVDVAVRDGRVYLDVPKGPQFRCVPGSAPDTFHLTDLAVSLEFVRSETGEVMKAVLAGRTEYDRFGETSGV